MNEWMNEVSFSSPLPLTEVKLTLKQSEVNSSSLLWWRWFPAALQTGLRQFICCYRLTVILTLCHYAFLRSKCKAWVFWINVSRCTLSPLELHLSFAGPLSVFSSFIAWSPSVVMSSCLSSFKQLLALLSLLQGWYSGPTQSQLHRGGQICAALRAGLSVKVPQDSQHLFGLSAG